MGCVHFLISGHSLSRAVAVRTHLFPQEQFYAVPGGELLRRLLIAPDIQRIFAYRSRVLSQLLEVLPAGDP